MKENLNKIVSGAAAAVLFVIGCIMAAVGLWVAFFLALFAMAAVGIALVASPLFALVQTPSNEEQEEATA